MSIAETRNQSVKAQAGAMANDIADEVKHEARTIRSSNAPVDITHSDTPVRHHVAGISISFFVLIALFLLAAIAAIAIYAYRQKPVPAQHVGAAAAMVEDGDALSARAALIRSGLRGSTVNGQKSLGRGVLYPEVHRSSYR